jgi:hypothetical protein
VEVRDEVLSVNPLYLNGPQRGPSFVLMRSSQGTCNFSDWWRYSLRFYYLLLLNTLIARNMLVRYTVYQIFEVIKVYLVLNYPSFMYFERKKTDRVLHIL